MEMKKDKVWVRKKKYIKVFVKRFHKQMGEALPK